MRCYASRCLQIRFGGKLQSTSILDALPAAVMLTFFHWTKSETLNHFSSNEQLQIAASGWNVISVCIFMRSLLVAKPREWARSRMISFEIMRLNVFQMEVTSRFWNIRKTLFMHTHRKVYQQVFFTHIWNYSFSVLHMKIIMFVFWMSFISV